MRVVGAVVMMVVVVVVKCQKGTRITSRMWFPSPKDQPAPERPHGGQNTHVIHHDHPGVFFSLRPHSGPSDPSLHAAPPPRPHPPPRPKPRPPSGHPGPVPGPLSAPAGGHAPKPRPPHSSPPPTPHHKPTGIHKPHSLPAPPPPPPPPKPHDVKGDPSPSLPPFTIKPTQDDAIHFSEGPGGCHTNEGFYFAGQTWFSKGCRRRKCIHFRGKFFTETDSCDSEIFNTTYKCVIRVDTTADFPYCCPTYRCNPDNLGNAV